MIVRSTKFMQTVALTLVFAFTVSVLSTFCKACISDSGAAPDTNVLQVVDKNNAHTCCSTPGDDCCSVINSGVAANIAFTVANPGEVTLVFSLIESYLLVNAVVTISPRATPTDTLLSFAEFIARNPVLLI